MKMNSVKVDNAAIESEEGIWQGDLPELGDIRVKVRGLNNKQYRLKFEAMGRALPPSKRKNGSIDPIERDRLIGICMLEHVLQDWENVEDPDPVPYSKEQARIYLTDANYQKFRDGVFIAASRVGEMIEEEDAATEKNSSKPSATS